MSMFTPEDILNAETAGEMATEFTPVPVGEYTATVKKVQARLVGEAKDRPVLDVTWEVDSDEAREITGLDAPTVRQTIFLDMDDNGALALGKGKNVQLGRLREALRQNGPTRWSPSMLEGCSATVRVEHRLVEDRTFAEVKGVASL